MKRSDRPAVFLITGPTASGKSALALRLAERIGGEIVNADALQIYRDLRLLTARPSPDEEARAPHHLYGTVDGAQGWSVGRWLRAATDLLQEIAGRGRPAVVTGGTGLYFRALTEGLAEIPPIAKTHRLKAQAQFDDLGEAAFREALAKVDPAAAARIAPGDRQRLVRAMEVYDASGRSLSEWQADTRPTLAPGSWQAAVLEPDRATLYARCDARLALAVRDGALDEVRELVSRGLDPFLPVMKAVGVRELATYLAGDLALDEALALAQRETRRYAKRQSTWLRNQTPDWPRLKTPEEIDQFVTTVAGSGGGA
ncbi:MAG TPA: tRNA (adenosine(37)-N6)-dimethylallyltransferase MiaA [Caulobacteraceae bacterium]|nr:tRNA (adenosine(37)-N6)-dimethylallyltransferase MiaA [Caulobacteraceae bacterium]